LNLSEGRLGSSPSYYKFAGLVAVALLTGLACLPFLISVFSLSDEGVLLQGADRLLRGERLYLDFFEFLPPGGFLLTAIWLWGTKINLIAARTLTVVVIVAIASSSYLIGYRILRSAAVAAIFALSWVAMSQGGWTQVNHHWFTTMFCMIQLCALVFWIDAPHRLLFLVGAGLAGGTAAMITPNRGALMLIAGLAAFSKARRQFGELIVYCVTALMMPVLLIFYVASQGALSAAFDSVILYPLEHYAGIQSVAYGAGWDIQNVLLVLLFPAATILAVLHIARDWRAALNDRLLRLFVCSTLAAFCGFSARSDIAHITFAAPLIIPLLQYCIPSVFFSARLLRLATVSVIGLALGLSLAFFLTVVLLTVRSPELQTPRGSVKVLRPDTKLIIQRIMDLPPDDTIFFYPFDPLLAFLTNRVNPSRLDVFLPNYTTVAEFENECRSVTRSAKWIIVDHGMIESWELAFPAMRGRSAPPERLQFERALARAFSFVARDGSFELRQTTGATATPCEHDESSLPHPQADRAQ
jgi:hypothetical protein